MSHLHLLPSPHRHFYGPFLSRCCGEGDTGRSPRNAVLWLKFKTTSPRGVPQWHFTGELTGGVLCLCWTVDVSRQLTRQKREPSAWRGRAGGRALEPSQRSPMSSKGCEDDFQLRSHLRTPVGHQVLKAQPAATLSSES